MIALPWVRDLRSGQVRREDRTGTVLAYLPSSRGQQAWKSQADNRLRALGWLLVDVPGGCEITKESLKGG